MVGGMVMAYFGGIHYWWPKMTGRLYPEGWAKLDDLRRASISAAGIRRSGSA
jgi:heme/copper-type cytochrome/quinol oxidase subunit 1